MINLVTGDATQPVGDGPKIIAHICNDVGSWGRGFVLAISRRWPIAERQYRMWSRRSTWESHIPPFALGSTQFVVVEPNITIANMVAQHGIRSVSNPAPYIPIRYDSLAICLDTVAVVAKEQGATVHMPRIGCGLADGRWEEVEPIIVDKMVSRGVAVYVYDLPGFPA